MDKYVINKQLEKLTRKKLNLIANESDDTEIKALELEISFLQLELDSLLKEESSQQQINSESADKIKKDYLNQVSEEIKKIDPVLFENNFPGVYKKLSTLLDKELHVKFGNNSGNGEIEIKEQDSKNFTLRYNYFCWDIKNSEIVFILGDSLELFLKSIQVKTAHAENYGSQGGHGSTTPVFYSGIKIITDIFRSFQKNILELED